MIQVTTEWVCTDCRLAIAGFSDHEIGHETVEPFENDGAVQCIAGGTSPLECETCLVEGEDSGSHDEHDRDSDSLDECAGCGRFGGEYHEAFAVTVERSL